MSEMSGKGSLPPGWIVKRSKSYPDMVYYFNLETGASTWECPELIPPDLKPNAKDKEADDMMPDTVKNNSDVVNKPSDDSVTKFATPPTAVVAPVQNRKKIVSPAFSPSEQKTSKRKRDSDGENLHNTGKSSSSRALSTKKKNISPLNKPCPEESINQPSSSKKKQNFLLNKPCSKESSSKESKLQEPSEDSQENTSENQTSTDEKDVEMRDVSVEILDDLTQKKENVFDTSACYYIVVDTNVLIRELHLISELKDTPLDGCGPPHIFIPWIVIEELDKIKSHRIPKASGGATDAIRYLNSVLGKHPRFHGQSPAEAEEWAKTYSKCNDDRILECCMGLSGKMPPEKVILLTNDKNLVNKALICDIQVHNFKSMMEKVKPDTKFDYKDIHPRKQKKKEKENEVAKSSTLSPDEAEEKFLQNKQDTCKRAIHTIMANVRLSLKDTLLKFVGMEMDKAYGAIWKSFSIKIDLLQGLLESIKKYWRTVYYEFFSEKDKRNFELLLDKASRPEGFLGDRDECLVILSAVEDVFRQISKRQPKLWIPIEEMHNHRLACVNAFIVLSDTESSLRAAEEKSVGILLDNNWTTINQMCGIVLDHYEISHDLHYFESEKRYYETEVEQILIVLYPAVEGIRKQLRTIFERVKKSHSVKTETKELSSKLLNFIPSLKLPCEPLTYPFFSPKAMERWFNNPQNRQKIEVGIKQIEHFYSKLGIAVTKMLSPGILTDQELEMICE